MSVALLGSTGMLGSMVHKVFGDEITIIPDRSENMRDLSDFDYVINCIGLIKPRITSVPDAVRVNSLFPYTLPFKTIQIATDCVFSGNGLGDYTEDVLHDATDVYGKTKSLGEAGHISNLRCSIIGPELQGQYSLLAWFLRQQSANGYTNHYWNGITTYHFARICQGMIREGYELPVMQHIVPADIVTKSELLQTIAEVYEKDIPITNVLASDDIDRTLSTNNPAMNNKLWELAGYSEPPTIHQMVQELRDFTK